jgi:hypothetical protein
MPALRCLGAGGTSLDMDSPAERVNEMRLSRRVEAPVGRAVRVAALCSRIPGWCRSGPLRGHAADRTPYLLSAILFPAGHLPHARPDTEPGTG